jgi:predicted acylesterase/phospholipase RssA
MEENLEVIENKKIIKHIVLSGGGVLGFSYYGLLKEANLNNMWSFENIETIYGTSVGSMLCVILCLKYDWETVDDYLIKRPWQHVYKLNLYSILEAFQKRGIFDIKVVEETFLPLFKGKDISIDVTMKEFFDITQIELHIFTTELTSYKLIDISYKTHPDWKVIEAVYSSSTLPIAFAPYIKDNKCYCDGGFLANYPLDHCIKNGANPEEIIGLNKICIDGNNNTINENSTLFDYIMLLINNTISFILKSTEKYKIKHEYELTGEPACIFSIVKTANESEERERLIEDGREFYRRG